MKGRVILVSGILFLYTAATDEQPTDPCGKPSASEQGSAFIQNYIDKKWNTDSKVSEAKELLELAKAKKLETNNLATVIDMSMYEWACANGYKIKWETRGFYFWKKNKAGTKGWFIGIRPSWQLTAEGNRIGYAQHQLDTRGRAMETYYLQVVITELPYDANKKSCKKADKEATELLNKILEHTHTWAVDYYTAIINGVPKK